MRQGRRLPVLSLAVLMVVSSCSSGSYDATRPPNAAAFNLAPHGRTVLPTSARAATGTVRNPEGMLHNRSTSLSGAGSEVVVDFGREVAGWITLRFGRTTAGPKQRLGLAFSESSLFTGPNSDATNGSGVPNGSDGALSVVVQSNGNYTMPADKVRLGFRYLTIFLETPGRVDIHQVTLRFSASPDMNNPDAYKGYFSSNDALLNQIWYAGAYTVQLNTIPPNHGRHWPALASGWSNDETFAPGNSVLAGGAKRDASLWSGDMVISDPTEYVSVGDMTPVRNALSGLFRAEKPDGQLPWAGPGINIYGSDTYHTWTLVDAAGYYSDTLDIRWLRAEWPRYERAMAYIVAKVDRQGLLNVTDAADWARYDMGGENIEANAILFRALVTGSMLADAVHEQALSQEWKAIARHLKAAVNARLWDDAAGSYRDNPTSPVYPEDGNSLAVWYGLVESGQQTREIVDRLLRDWNRYGAVAREYSEISPFADSMEVMALFIAGQDDKALALIRREWGYMLKSPIGTASTFWEVMTQQGGLLFDSYESLAHGWSTGPTSALTFYVAGLQPTGEGGRTYIVMPHVGDLRHVEANLVTGPGRRLADSWSRTAKGITLLVDSRQDRGSSGMIAVPTFGRTFSIKLNGHLITPSRTIPGYAYLSPLGPGRYIIDETSD